MSRIKDDRKTMTTLVLVVVALLMILSVSAIFNALSGEKRVVSAEKLVTLSRANGVGAAVSQIGTTTVCINAQPIIIEDCDLANATLNINQQDSFECTFNATDYNNDPLVYEVVWIEGTPFFNMTEDGNVTYNITQASVGEEHVFQVYVYDDSVCTNNYALREYHVNISGLNTAPYLVQNIADQTLSRNYYVILNLNDYFADAEQDPLSYFPIISSGNTVSVTMTGSRADIKGTGCGNSTMYFVAADPGGLTNISNTVRFSVTCDNENTVTSTDSDSGGGGSGSNDDSETRTCTPDWRCSQWSQCRPENKSYRACVDYHGCSASNYRKFFEEACTYVRTQSCSESWECNEWSTCIDDVRTRSCLDISSCGTIGQKPPEQENCTIIPTCFNGFQDNDETGPDCGGQCGACRNIESPAQVNNNATGIILSSLLSISMVLGLFIYYRKKITAWYAKMTMRKRIQRRIYISAGQKDRLLKMFSIMQARLDEHKIAHAIAELNIFIREYFRQLIAVDSLTKQELIKNITKLDNKNLEKILIMYYARAVSIVNAHSKGVIVDEAEFEAFLDETSHNIYLIAEFNDADAIASVKDRPNKNEGSAAVYTRLSNIYIALKFGELLVAKDEYKEVLKTYESLSSKDKYGSYNDIIRSFHAIEYLENEYKKK